MTKDRDTILRRRVLAAAAVAVVLLGAVLGVTMATGAAGEPPPATGAAALVPADALAYVNLSTDRARPGVKRALELERRLPQLAPLLSGVRARIASVAGGSAAAGNLSSWLGGEAAVAVLDTPSATAGVLVLAAVRDAARARSALAEAGARALSPYRGRPLWRLASGNDAALSGPFLLVGDDASVRAGIDVAAGAAPSLAGSDDYRRATSGEPSGRFLDVYASAPGVRRLLESRHDAFGALGLFLDQPALTAVAVSLTAQSPGLGVQVHSTLDPKLAGLHGSSAHGLAATLPSVVPSGSALMLDSDGLTHVAGRVLAAGALTGAGGRSGQLLSRLGAALAAEGVNINSLLSVFAGETAVFIGPSRRANPSVMIVSKTSDPATARATLASLAIPLAQLFQTSSSADAGQSPVLSDHQIGSVTVHQISLSPGLQLYYTVSGGLVIASTGLGEMQSVLEHRSSLAADPGYRATVSSGSSSMTSLLFLDFSQLLNLGEQTGLTQGTRSSALRAGLQGIRAAGLVSTGGETDSTAELLLQIP